MSLSSGCKPLGEPQLCGTGAGIALNFVRRRGLRRSGEKMQRSRFGARVWRMARRMRTRVAVAREELLDDAIFQTVERDHGEAAFGRQNLECGIQPAFQFAQFV